MITDSFRPILEQIAQTGETVVTTPRSLLGHYGYVRRGRWINGAIRSAMRSHGVASVPDFETAYIDGEIALQRLEAPPMAADRESANQNPTGPLLLSGGSVPDPVSRIRLLAAANRTPISVRRDHGVREAVTLMLINDFSQLPVMGNERDVYGMISWRSIGRARALNRPAEFVRDCMEEAAEIPDHAAMLEAIALVGSREAVLVRGADRRIVGLVTTSDLSLEFRTQAEPFLLLAEIENHLRRLIDGRYSRETIEAAQDVRDSTREVEDVSDLTFGEYIRLLQDPVNWAVLGVDLDRSHFCSRLDRVRGIRNDVMHFNPDGTSEGELEILRDTVRLLQQM
jgi:CBS domain-containing protein